MSEIINRRSFFGTTAAAGSALAMSAGRVNAQSRRKPSSTELLQVGVVALGDNSHMNYEIWAPMINPIQTPRWPYGRTTRMIITHCWDKDPERARAFAKKYSCEAVTNYDDMVGKVDGMIYAGFNECKWWPQLTKPYLEAGTPCFINRPFAYSMKDAKAMVETAKKYNTPILCTDERESIQQAVIAREKVREILKDGGRIIGAHSSNATSEWSQHGVHGLYYLLAVLGLDVETAGYQADGWWKEVTPTATKQHYGQLSLQYRGITFDDGAKQTSPFIVAQLQSWARADITMRLYHNMGWWDVAHEYTPGRHEDPRLFYLFFPTILAMQQMFETRKMPWSYDYILGKTKIFLTAFKSHLEHNGAMIPVDVLPDDWEAPSPYADWIDESIFS